MPLLIYESLDKVKEDRNLLWTGRSFNNVPKKTAIIK
jgi:hypothetical protein